MSCRDELEAYSHDFPRRPRPRSSALYRLRTVWTSSAVIRARQEAATSPTAFVDGGSVSDAALRPVGQSARPTGTSSLLIWPKNGLLGRLQITAVTTFVGLGDGGKVRFAAATVPGAGSTCGAREVGAPIARGLLKLERRGAVRVRLEQAKSAVCGVPQSGRVGEWEASGCWASG